MAAPFDVVPERTDLLLWVDGSSINGSTLINKVNPSQNVAMTKAPTLFGNGILFDGSLTGTITVSPYSEFSNATVLIACSDVATDTAIFGTTLQGTCIQNASNRESCFLTSSGTRVTNTSTAIMSKNNVVGYRYARSANTTFSLIEETVVTQTKTFGSNPLVSSTMMIGGYPLGGFNNLIGVIQCVKFYNSALSDAEIEIEARKIRIQYY